jgi:hypothetical protein
MQEMRQMTEIFTARDTGAMIPDRTGWVIAIVVGIVFVVAFWPTKERRFGPAKMESIRRKSEKTTMVAQWRKMTEREKTWEDRNRQIESHRPGNRPGSGSPIRPCPQRRP